MRSAGLPIGHVPRTLAGYFRSVLEDGCVFAEVTGDPIPSFSPWPEKDEEGGGIVLPYCLCMKMNEDDMNKIRDGLYLGNGNAAYNVEHLSECGISHLLTLNDSPLEYREGSSLILKFIPCLDTEETDLLSQFETCFKFIQEALSRPSQAVLVHCQAGISRSATIVIAYLMYKEQLSLVDAVTSVKKQRPVISPNDGFYKQLQLFERMGSVINVDDDLYRQYKLQILASKVELGDTDAVTSILKQVPHSTRGVSASYYKCAKCRRILFKKSNVLSHAVGIGEEAFGWQSKLSNQISHSAVIHGRKAGMKCDRSLFIEPVQWMSEVITQEVEGKLSCPQCNVKLGSFVWYGEKCPCGTWVTPAFHIQTSKVDLVKQRPPLPISQPGFSLVAR